MKIINLTIDVTEAISLGEAAHIAATVHLPAYEQLTSPTVICFAKPGAGFSRHYFTSDLPGPAQGSQAEWHALHGCVFVSIDHLGVGESSVHEPSSRLDFTTVVAASHYAEAEILNRLRAGTLDTHFDPIDNIVSVGIGHSMGGLLTICQQGRYHDYDGIAVLGFSPTYGHTPTLAGLDPIIAAWRLPGKAPNSPSVVLNARHFSAAFRKFHGEEPSDDEVLANRSPETNRWLYFYDDVLEHLAAHGSQPSPWASATTPGLIKYILTPSIVAPEAAAVDVPVLVVAAERDIISDLKSEPRAYLSAKSIDLFECPRMGHMHNFAGTRGLLWQRINLWIDWVVASRDQLQH